MLSYPSAEELVETIAADMFKRREMAGFPLRVASNGLAIAAAELKRRDRIAAEGAARLEALLGEAGDYQTLNALLCERLASGAIDLSEQALLDHLWATTIDVLAVEQPRYATYRAVKG